MTLRVAVRVTLAPPRSRPLALLRAALLYADEIAVRLDITLPGDVDIYCAPPISALPPSVHELHSDLAGVLAELDIARRAGVLKTFTRSTSSRSILPSAGP